MSKEANAAVVKPCIPKLLVILLDYPGVGV
jgi:hypothetical protein